MDDKNPRKVNVEQNIIRIDPVTVTAIVTALILLPLLITGFVSQ